jgi:hypothetical protein
MRTIKTIFVIVVLMPIIGRSQHVDIPWHNHYWYDSLGIHLFKTYNVKVLQNDTIISQYSEYSYDPKKNELEIDYFDEFGQRIKKGTRYKIFNECGVLIEKKNEGESWINEMCIDTPHTTYKFLNATFTTDSSGRITSRASDTLYVGNGLYHASRKIFEYDSSGLLIKTNQIYKNGLDSIPVTTETGYTYSKQMRLDTMTRISIKGTVRKSNISWIKYDGHIAELYSMQILEESP